jgi:capsular exopolysaccharide synthesis family protein
MLPADSKRLLNGPDPENGAASRSLSAPAADGAPVVPPALSAPPSLAALLRAGRRRWPALLGLGVLGAALSAGMVWAVYPAKYVVQALLHVASSNGRGGFESEADFSNFQRTQAALLKSQPILRAALDKPEVAQLREVRAQGEPVAWLQKSLTTDTTLGPEVLRVSLAGDYPDDLPVVVNEVVRAYLRDYAIKEEGRAANRLRQLQENHRRCAEHLREKRQRVRAREQQLGLDEPQIGQVRYQMALQQLAAAQSQKLQAQLDRQKVQEEQLSLRARIRTPESATVSKAAVDDELRQEPAVRKQLERLAAAEEALQRVHSLSNPSAREGLLEGPRAERDAIQQALEGLQKELRPGIEARLQAKALDEAKTNLARVETQLAFLDGQERTLDGVVRNLETQVEGLRFSRSGPERVTADLEALRDDVAQTEQVLKKIGDELGTLAAEPSPAGRITLLEASEVPTSRAVDRQLKAVGAAGFGAFGLIVVGLTMLEFRARRVSAVADVARGLGLPVIGTLPPIEPDFRIPPTGSLPVIDLSDSVPDAADAFRAVFLHLARQEQLKVVMVTSAVEGEGKTRLATQLAATLARAWRRTLLVDCDLRHPTAHEALDVRLEPGFCDALRGTIEFEEAIRTTTVNRLWMIPAGRCDDAALDGLPREDVAEVFERLKRHYDFIIVNAAPVLPVADSLVIGKHADAALLAVLRDVSRLPAVHAAQRRLTRLGVRVLGAVVLGEKSGNEDFADVLDLPILK